MALGQPDTPRPGLARVRWWYLRGLGFVFCLAFASLMPQLQGLLGPEGLSPAGAWLDWARTVLVGAERYTRVPTLLWLTGASTAALQGLTVAGLLCGVLLLLDVAPRYALIGAWACYLSITVVGDPFLSFQWDVLLLEAALVSLPLTPGHLRPPRVAPEPSRGAVLLVRFLLFRLMVLSGLVKLASGDRTWRDFTALAYHFWTQPLPTPMAYFANLLPGAVLRASTAIMFFTELVAPFLLFGPRRLRLTGAALLALLQVGILVTGNYGFFNVLSLVLCLAALDDRALRWLRIPGPRTEDEPAPPPSREAPAAEGTLIPPHSPGERGGGPRVGGPAWLRAWGFRGFAAVYVVLAVSQDASRLLRWTPPAPVSGMLDAVGAFRSINTYGLFAVMTTRREEVVLQGSEDGRTWREYLLHWRPGRLDEAPRIVAPHMPRLDWQLWFAALSTCRDNPWLLRLQDALLRGEPTVLGFFRENPFPAAPPRYLRTVRYDYRFTDFATLRATGDWWARREVGPYCPPLTLQGGELQRAELPTGP